MTHPSPAKTDIHVYAMGRNWHVVGAPWSHTEDQKDRCMAKTDYPPKVAQCLRMREEVARNAPIVDCASDTVLWESIPTRTRYLATPVDLSHRVQKRLGNSFIYCL